MKPLNIACEFFQRLSTEVAATQTANDASASDGGQAPPSQVLQEPVAAPPAREGVAPEIWVVGLIAIIVILLVLFGLVL